MAKTATKSATTLDPKTPQEQALQAVQQAGAQANQLIDLWLQHQNTAALSEVSSRGQGGPRKAARRALRILKSRGVDVPRVARVAKLGGTSPQTLKAWLLAPDPAFNLVLAVARRSDTSRFDTALFFLNDDYGVTQVQHSVFSKSALSKALTQMVPGARYEATEVEVQWAQSRVRRALALQKERGRILPLGLTSVANLLGDGEPSELPHPFDAEGFEVALDDAREMSKTSAQLHSLPEFRAWLPPRAALNDMLQEVGRHLRPGEQPEQSKMQELLQKAVVSATDRFFTPEQRERLVRVMKDSALSVFAREGEAMALRVSATMQCIQNAGLITDPPSEVPFLRAFFDKGVAYLLSEGKGSLQIPIPNAAPGEAEAETLEEPAAEAEEANAEQADAEQADAEQESPPADSESDSDVNQGSSAGD